MNLFNKYHLGNGIFKVRINVLCFKKITPLERYLFISLFKNMNVLEVNFVNVKSLFEENMLFVSGKNLYDGNKKINIPTNGNFILAGMTYEIFLDKLLNNKNVNIYVYENSKTILFEKI
ncbi:MAG: hypothetical protein MST00_03780 [Tenericutes bacterium]|nr:hypothetical protein [Mycoplasmatota bacterium]